MKLVFIIALASAWTAGSALAQAVPLTDEEIRAEFLGTRMSGVLFETGVKFVECIEPDGRSIYRYGDYSSEGAMTSVKDGVACFTYEPSTFCYDILRHPGGYIVSNPGGGAHFIITTVERGVTRCTAADLIG
ncbi:MAG: hypothetical protein R3B94_13655 [Hyphomonas sp.]